MTLIRHCDNNMEFTRQRSNTTIDYILYPIIENEGTNIIGRVRSKSVPIYVKRNESMSMKKMSFRRRLPNLFWSSDSSSNDNHKACCELYYIGCHDFTCKKNVMYYQTENLTAQMERTFNNGIFR